MNQDIAHESKCRLCPRECGADRALGQRGYCGIDGRIKIARAALHYWEEPSISGAHGSGTVFFSGCNLKCVYCQNKEVSHHRLGTVISENELEDTMLRLQAEGAENINLVTPTHYSDTLAKLLYKIKGKLNIPVVWNSSGYEKPETLEILDGLIDIYLPDFKYADTELAGLYSDAPDYPEVALKAIHKMYSQVGKNVFGDDGLLKRGMIIRHLVLPGCRKNSFAVLDAIASSIPVSDVKISLMSQYTPDFAIGCGFKNLERRITTFEYDSVLRYAEKLGFDGYFQERTSADKCYTPEFYGDKE